MWVVGYIFSGYVFSIKKLCICKMKCVITDLSNLYVKEQAYAKLAILLLCRLLHIQLKSPSSL